MRRITSRQPKVQQLSREEAQQYWRSPPDNPPQGYILGRQAPALDRSRWLADLIAANSPKEDSIQEIGCNVGRNLNVLYESGFYNLYGIDINSDALALLRNTYPELARTVKLSEGSVEEWIRDIKDKQFDVVFCSDLKRAVDSARLAFADKYEVIEDERLREVNYGDFNGKPAGSIGDLIQYISKAYPSGGEL